MMEQWNFGMVELGNPNNPNLRYSNIPEHSDI